MQRSSRGRSFSSPMISFAYPSLIQRVGRRQNWTIPSCSNMCLRVRGYITTTQHVARFSFEVHSVLLSSNESGPKSPKKTFSERNSQCLRNCLAAALFVTSTHLAASYPSYAIDSFDTLVREDQKLADAKEETYKQDIFDSGALIALRRGDYVTAEKLWTKIIDKYPSKPGPFKYRGVMRAKQAYDLSFQFHPEFLIGAVDDFNKAEARVANGKILPAVLLKEIYIERAKAYDDLGRFQEAVDDYTRVLSLEEDNAEALVRRAQVYGRWGKWPESLRLLAEAEKVSSSPDIRVKRALVAYELGNKREALQALIQLARQNPKNAEVFVAITAVYWLDPNEDTQDLAEGFWKKAVAIQPRVQDVNWIHARYRWPPSLYTGIRKFLGGSGPQDADPTPLNLQLKAV